MSGDSSDKPYKNKEESELLVPDKSKIGPITTATAAGTLAVTDPILEEHDFTNSNEKTDEKFINRSEKDTKVC